MSTKLYQVFLQEDSESELKVDIAFSEGEAQKAIVDFYNDKFCKPSGELLTFQDIEAVRTWQKQHPGVEQKAWYEDFSVEDDIAGAEEPSKDISSFVRNPLQEDASLQGGVPPNILVEQLFPLLHQAGIDVEMVQLTRLVNKAYDLSIEVMEFSPEAPSTEEREDSLEEDEVLLVHVGDEDVGLYFGSSYIDSASKSEENIFDEVITTAEMLAQRQRTSVKSHFFEDMPEGWNWSRVETILARAGILTQKPELLLRLKDAPHVKVNDLIPAEVHWFDAAYDAYAQKGEENLELIRFDFHKGELLETISLSVGQIVRSIEISEDFWVCGDLYGTQILFSSQFTPSYLSSILR